MHNSRREDPLTTGHPRRDGRILDPDPRRSRRADIDAQSRQGFARQRFRVHAFARGKPKHVTEVLHFVHFRPLPESARGRRALFDFDLGCAKIAALDDLIRQIRSMNRGTRYYVPRTLEP